MANLKDIYNQLKTTIIGTKTTNIDTALNNAINDIISYKTNANKASYVELVKNLISKSTIGNSYLNNLTPNGSGGLSGLSGADLSIYGQSSRLNRYKSYESITSMITYCNRALQVLVDNILSPDDITKVSLDIKSNSYLEDTNSNNSKVEILHEILKHLKLEYHLDFIIRNTLLYGDFFIEIADSKTALTGKSYLIETFNYEQNIVNSMLSNKDILSINEWNGKVIMDYSSFMEDSSTKKTDKKNYKNLKILFHHPKHVVKLQSEIFPLCFGYLVFPKYSINPQQAINDQVVNQICMQILKSVEQKVPEIKEISGKENTELKQIISQMVKDSDPNQIMNVRFIPTSKMQHFNIPSTKYYPYGESIFDSVQFLAKMLIALETASTIYIMNRSTEKRKILVETGLSRDARSLLEEIKEQFKKRKVSLDDLSIETTSSSVSNFEDIYLPQKDGKPFIDVQSFNEGVVDVRNKVELIKYVRDAISAGMGGIPPSYLGIDENVNSKSTLSEESIIFARTIINHQKYFNSQVYDLIQKIIDIAVPEDSLIFLDNIDINFMAPKSLQFERQSKYTNDMVSLIETLERIGIPKEYSKKRFITDIDWEEVEKFINANKIDNSLHINKTDDQSGGFGGGYGSTGY